MVLLLIGGVASSAGAETTPIVIPTSSLALPYLEQRIPGPGSEAGPTAPVVGGGTTFPVPLYRQWIADVDRSPYFLDVNYQAAGSNFGRLKFLTGELDFGGTDTPYLALDQPALAASSRKSFAYVPTTAAGLGFMYNLKDGNGNAVTDLRLTPREACRIFTEPNMFWDDPALLATNPSISLQHHLVRPVVRSDGAGTSYSLSQFCLDAAPAVWATFVSFVVGQLPDQSNPDLVSGQPTAQWPQGFGQVSWAYASEGVANVVNSDVVGQDSITYDEAEYALQRGRPNASVLNPEGEYTQPTPGNVTAALAFAQPHPDGTYAPTYTGNDPAEYFPVTSTYILVPTAALDTAEGRALATFLNYAVTDGQMKAPSLSFARLPDGLVNSALDQIAKIPGAPPRSTGPQPVVPEAPVPVLLAVAAMVIVGVRYRRIAGDRLAHGSA